MLIRPTAFTIGLIIRFSIALFYVYTEFGIDSFFVLLGNDIHNLSRLVLFLSVHCNNFINCILECIKIVVIINAAHKCFAHDIAVSVNDIRCRERSDTQCKFSGIAVHNAVVDAQLLVNLVVEAHLVEIGYPQQLALRLTRIYKRT